MAERLPVKSGKEVLKTFHRGRECFNITFKRMGKGDHVVLHNKFCMNFSVPLHSELKKDTLMGIIRNAGLTKTEFLEYDP